MRVLINLTYLLELHILVPVTDTALAVVARRALQLLLRVVPEKEVVALREFSTKNARGERKGRNACPPPGPGKRAIFVFVLLTAL